MSQNIKKRRIIMIAINNIITFVERAIEKNFIIDCGYNNITVGQEDNRFISFNLCEDKNIINISGIKGEIQIKIEQKDTLKFLLLIEDCLDYRRKKALEEFNNFFKEGNSKPTDINDLDNEDD